MDELIPLINRLQDVFSATKQFNNIVNVEGYDNNHSGRSLANMIQLPQIVVVGAQSSGKSSVLESIVGRDFLPRGPGIVTRRPLVLQLVHVPPKVSGEASENESSDKIGEEYGVFLHKKDQFFYNFADIRREISEETNRVSGTNKGVSSKPINLKIYSHRVVDLTLIDLPGIARVPVGDQPTDIEKKIRQLVLEYISNPNSIILAVTAANTDIANSDALHLAMQVDPSGERTLGVLTKVDLMDKGTNALEILNGNHVPLKLGYVAVINRSQEDVFSNKSIEAALDAESQYFAEHLAYRNISFRCGTPFLTKSLNSLLVRHIKKNLPELKVKIERQVIECEKELESFGFNSLNHNENQGACLLQLISKFCSAYSDSIDGKLQPICKARLHGGAKINYIFNNFFEQNLKGIDPSDHLSDDDIQTAIRNSSGPRHSLFIPELAFEVLVKSQIRRLEHPSLECVDYVFRELQDVALYSAMNSIARYEKLQERVCSSVSILLSRCLEPAREMVKNLIQCELAYINTSHPDFVGGSQAIAEISSRRKQRLAISAKQATDPSHAKEFENTRSEKEKIEIEIIKILIDSYFKIVKLHIQDAVPKAVMHFLVNTSKETIQSELVKNLYKEELLSDLLVETDEFAIKRNTCAMYLDSLKKALSIVQEVRDMEH